jgi:hypothetical protein
VTGNPRIFEFDLKEDSSYTDNIFLKFSQADGEKNPKMTYSVYHSETFRGGFSTSYAYPLKMWVLVQLIHRADTSVSIYWDGVEMASKASCLLPRVVENRRWVFKWHSEFSMKEVAFFNGEANFQTLSSYAHDATKKYWIADQVSVKTITTLGSSIQAATNDTLPPCDDEPDTYIKNNVCWRQNCPAGKYRKGNECFNMTNSSCPSGQGFDSASSKAVEVTKVVVVNNNDAKFANTFNGAQVVVGDSSDAFDPANHQCGDTIEKLSAGESHSLLCRIPGRYIFVRVPRSTSLFIAEVVVEIDNVEFTGGTTSSSPLQAASSGSWGSTESGETLYNPFYFSSLILNTI